MAERGDIDRVREATDLVELISEVTQVKKSGRSYMAVCPFHQEKTPSMSIDRARGLYHCFGCGKGGDVFEFVQETRGVDFREALDMLAAKAGITLVRDPAEAKQRGRRAAAIDALRRAVDVYHQRLKKALDAGPARSYLRGRGYDVDLIDEWKLGFAGTDWDTLAKSLRTEGIDERVIIDAGLGRRGRHGVYDFFRGRLMFPIHDLRGDPIGFGGRKIEEVDRNATNNPDAKYVNSADSPVYQKSRVLFGLDRARQRMDDDNPAVVVEGYTDVIAMHLAGVKTAVATCGTALGEGHFDLLRRFTDRVVLAMDSDEAGRQGAIKGDDLDMPFNLDIDMRVAMMPDNLDPADLVQTGRSAEMIEAVKASRPLLEMRIERAVGRFDVKGPEGRARALQSAVDLLRRINHELARYEYARFASRLVGVDVDVVLDAVRKGRVEQPTPPVRKANATSDALGGELLRLVLTNPGALELVDTDLRDERLRSVLHAVRPMLQEGYQVEATAIEDPGARETALSLMTDQRPLPDIEDMARLLTMRRLEAEIDDVEAEVAGMDENSESYSESLRRLIALQQEKRSLGQ